MILNGTGKKKKTIYNPDKKAEKENKERWYKQKYK